MLHDKTVQALKESNPNALLADGLEDALLGVVTVPIGKEVTQLAAYSMQKVIEVIMRRDDMQYAEAEEYASSNIFNAHGENMPVYIDELRNINMTWLGMKVRPEDMYEF